ncbi:ABC transporter substrate-binding protein [Sporichthya polymorpha]|uniref:ABC transporter substrate-binding protein n=1 Tax=Sporichthya polymorpha TaxID=35751 RepID=UPI000374A31D|nr:ABC transporter substrate-binding protein [Sporichthya polymorpha]
MLVHEIDDAATRRQFLSLIAAAGFLAACADDDDDAGPSASSTPTATRRTVDGAYGPVEIPTDPQRIFADLMTVDYLTALGYDTTKVIGCFDATSYREDPQHYLHTYFATRELADPGFQYDMNVEIVAAAQPDLILLPFDQIDGSGFEDDLRQIAPLLVVPTSETRDPGTRYGGTASFQDWRATLRAYGKLLGRETQAEEYITETDGMLAALSAEYGSLISSLGVTEAKSTPDFVAINVLSAAGERGVLGTILLSELGFQAPDVLDDVEVDEYGTIELSRERVDLLECDLLFLEVRGGSTAHEESPLWDTLDVVEDGNVVIVGNHWEFGGAVAARKVIADIDHSLGKLAAASPAPTGTSTSTASPES